LKNVFQFTETMPLWISPNLT